MMRWQRKAKGKRQKVNGCFYLPHPEGQTLRQDK